MIELTPDLLAQKIRALENEVRAMRALIQSMGIGAQYSQKALGPGTGYKDGNTAYTGNLGHLLSHNKKAETRDELGYASEGDRASLRHDLWVVDDARSMAGSRPWVLVQTSDGRIIPCPRVAY